MSEAPYQWIERVEQAARLTQKVPLWGMPPSFPWEEFKSRLSQTWNLSPLDFKETKVLWRTQSNLLEGLGSDPVINAFSLTPLKGKAFLVMSKEDVNKLNRSALSTNSQIKSFTDPTLQEGFFEFLLLEALHAIETLNPFVDFSINLDEEVSLPEGALCIDLQIQLPEYSLWARILCDENLNKSFQEHFVKKPLSFPEKLAQSLEVSLKVEIGQTALTLAQWKKIKEGDLLLLDRCTFDPKSKKGSANLVLENIPLFHVRLKEEGIKVLDYAFYYEEEKTTMNDYDDDEDLDDNEDFDDDDDDDFEDDDDDDFDDDDFDDDDDDDDDFDEEDDDDDSDEEDQDEIQNDEEDDVEKLSSDNSVGEANPTEPLWSAPAVKETVNIGKKISTHKIPLTVTVEVTRLKLTVEKLLQLQPGNELSLPVRPEQGVDLLINGKKIAKGELIKIGEALGVRILQIGA